MVLSLSESWYGALIPTRRLRYRLANANHKKLDPIKQPVGDFLRALRGK